VPYGTFILDCVTKGDIAITFDDGPYLYTNDLLDLLARYGVKATFFIVGNNGNGAIDQIPQWTNVVQRMDREGHHIASHTWGEDKSRRMFGV
jgi:peptidoglycan/xylan/chitin deacetylase (PgdA/CDA1 family)